MNKSRKFLLTLFIALFCAIGAGKAQEVIVTVRPPIPHYERVVAPSPRHIWIEEEWENRGGRYVFVGGHWAEPPHPGWGWIHGHWQRNPRGEYWVPGRWDGRHRDGDHRDRR